MNHNLVNAIAYHIFSGLAIVPSNFINIHSTKPLTSKEYLLSETIPFTLDDGTDLKNKVWGCQLLYNQEEVKMLLADCTIEKDVTEYALLVALKGAPTYGIYLIMDSSQNVNANICFSMNGEGWLEAPTYLQGTFLAGMEQIKDIGLNWSKPSSYKEDFARLIKFIEFNQDIGEIYEG